MVEENEMSAAQKKLFELRMRVNAGRKANKTELIAEHDRMVQSGKKNNASQPSDSREQKVTNKRVTFLIVVLIKSTGLKEKKRRKSFKTVYLNESAECVEQQLKKQQKKDKRRAAFGWDVFNQDSLYKAYKKRLQNLPTTTLTDEETAVRSEDTMVRCHQVTQEGLDRMSKELEERMKTRKKFSRRRQHYEGEDVDYINDQNRLFNRKASKAFDKYTEGLDRMSKELEERMKTRKKFSRRRQHYEGEDVDYINDQNRLFNRKASKAFDKYTVEIRQNLERGTAL
ncbi:hypothetical protein ABG067_003170 [Albugo candida]